EFIDAVDLEWANVESALEFCASSAGDGPMGLQMATDLWSYWSVRGRFFLGFRHLKKLVARTSTPDPVRALGLRAYGLLAQGIGDDIAVDAFEEARSISLQTGGHRERAHALMGLGVICLRHGELMPAIELLVSSMDEMDQSDDATGRALIRNYLGTT